MEIALKLALKGVGNVNPNPLVGSIIVKEGKIIGQGYHEYYGGNMQKEMQLKIQRSVWKEVRYILH